jgi:Protein of unknown function (DUF2800).
MPDHALLSASSSHRWLSCPPSAKLCAAHPDTTSPYAQQGTEAHSLAAYKVMKALGMDAKDPTRSLEFFDQEMADCTDAYCAFVMEQLAEAKKHCADPVVLVEQRLDFSRWVPEGFGTGDACIVADDVLQVIDLKYGVGILVSAEHNPQMMCYALGLLEAYDGIYDVRTIRMSIFQPRRENETNFEMSKADLLGWAETVLLPTAQLAFKGEGEFRAGEHCQFCSVKATCRKRTEYNLEMARYDFEVPSELTNDEIAAILPRIDELIAWGGDVKEYALRQAVSGTHYPGFKLVEGRSVTKYTDEEAAAAAVKAAGEDPYERKLLGITAMKALLGRKRFDEILGGLTFKPSGKPTLVPESDKRPAMTTAKNDFEEDTIHE